jgi:eukaryotic-like serine/threonine-protein kinase
MPLAARSSLGPYQIVACIGAGGMGEVYQARDTRLKRNVALKVLPESVAKNPQRRARFQHEAEVLAALNHPNIATIYGIEESTSTTALIMELVEGVSLADKIHSRSLHLAETLDLAIQIANGLEAAHNSGVVHRDLKPSNVMVTPTGVVKLVDFGLAKFREPPARSDEETETIAADLKTEEGQILGTVAYMSPEQAQGRPVDGRSDIFSFGVLLYEVLTGCMPFQGESKAATLAAILQRDPRPFAGAGVDLPREAERIVLRCLRKDPDRRFQTVADLRISLEDLREDLSTGQLGLTPPVVPRRSHWQLAVGAIVVLGLCGAAAALLVSRIRPLASHPLTQITFEASIARDAALSPDGKLLAYVSDRGNEDQFEIWLKQLAGGEPLRLTSGVGSKSNPQFSSDGTKVYYLSGDDLFEVPSLGGVSRKVWEHVGPLHDRAATRSPSIGLGPPHLPARSQLCRPTAELRRLGTPNVSAWDGPSGPPEETAWRL